MTDYGTQDRQRFLRQLRYMAALRALYIAICGLSLGALLWAVIHLFSKGHS